MKPHKPFLSVGMIVHNAERYVGEAVQSILRQTYTDFELVIVDDGSTDNSGKILAKLARDDTRIRLISSENRGISPARNLTLEVSRGDFYAIMDADDVALPHRLERQLSYLRKHNACVCVGAWYHVIDEADRYLTTLQTPLTNVEIQSALLKGHTSISQPTSMLRKEAVERVGRFDERLVSAEDLDLYLRLGELGELANIPEALLRYRIHKKSASSVDRTRQHEDARRACERAWKRRDITEQFEPVQPWRPDNTRAAQYEWILKCGWWAFESRERLTGFMYGLKAIVLQPFQSGGWRLSMCSLMKLRRKENQAR